MISTSKMVSVYGMLSTKSNRLASRFHFLQERVRRCTKKHPCKLHACPLSLRKILDLDRQLVRLWFQSFKVFELTRITLHLPMVVGFQDLYSVTEKIRRATTKLLRGKKTWPRPLRGHLLTVHVDVVPMKPGSTTSRFRFSVHAVVATSVVDRLLLARRWKYLIGAAGLPRRVLLASLVKLDRVGSFDEEVRYLLPTSSALLRQMPAKPFAASSYVEILPRLCKVMVAGEADDCSL